MRRQLILSRFLSTPLALSPEYIHIAYSVLSRWDAGISPSDTVRAKTDEDKAIRAAQQQDMKDASQGAVAVLPLFGMLVQHPVDDVSGPGATSIDRWGAQLQALVDDPAIGKIIVPINGPGGEVYGIKENADLIYQARATKPVIGIANSCAASAHYWLASQMSEFYVTPGGEVGSIGVRSAIVSLAEQLKADGIDWRVITSSAYKAEGDPSQPITDEAVGSLEARVAEYGAIFVEDVARGRGVRTEAVRNGMGQGRMLGAAAAQAEKMVDGIMTFSNLMAKHTSGLPPTANARRGRSRAAAELAILQAGC